MTAAPAHEYSDAELRSAFAACRHYTWPATFEEAMQDPLRARLVRINAARRAHPTSTPPRPRTGPVARPATHTLPLRHEGWIDHKRAASGDRDE